MCKSFNLRKHYTAVAQMASLQAKYCIVGIPHNTAI